MLRSLKRCSLEVHSQHEVHLMLTKLSATSCELPLTMAFSKLCQNKWASRSVGPLRWSCQCRIVSVILTVCRYGLRATASLGLAQPFRHFMSASPHTSKHWRVQEAQRPQNLHHETTAGLRLYRKQKAVRHIYNSTQYCFFFYYG